MNFQEKKNVKFFQSVTTYYVIENGKVIIDKKQEFNVINNNGTVKETNFNSENIIQLNKEQIKKIFSNVDN